MASILGENMWGEEKRRSWKVAQDFKERGRGKSHGEAFEVGEGEVKGEEEMRALRRKRRIWGVLTGEETKKRKKGTRKRRKRKNSLLVGRETQCLEDNRLWVHYYIVGRQERIEKRRSSQKGEASRKGIK